MFKKIRTKLLKQNGSLNLDYKEVKNNIEIESMKLDNRLLKQEKNHLEIKIENTNLKNIVKLPNLLNRSGKVLYKLALLSCIISTILSFVGGWLALNQDIVKFISFGLVITVCQVLIYITSRYETIIKNNMFHHAYKFKMMQVSMFLVSFSMNLIFFYECFNSFWMCLIMIPLCFILDYSTIIFNNVGYDKINLILDQNKKIGIFTMFLNNVFFNVRESIVRKYTRNNGLNLSKVRRKLDRKDSPLVTKDSPLEIEDSPLEIEDSPLEIEDSPTLGNSCTIFENNSPLEIEDSPLGIEDSPLTTKDSPLTTKDSPLVTKDSPLVTKDSPLEIEDSPLEIEDSPLEIEDSPTLGNSCTIFENNSPLEIEDSPLGIEDSPLTTKDSPLTTKDSPLTTKDSPLGFNHLLYGIVEDLKNEEKTQEIDINDTIKREELRSYLIENYSVGDKIDINKIKKDLGISQRTWMSLKDHQNINYISPKKAIYKEVLDNG